MTKTLKLSWSEHGWDLVDVPERCEGWVEAADRQCRRSPEWAAYDIVQRQVERPIFVCRGHVVAVAGSGILISRLEGGPNAHALRDHCRHFANNGVRHIAKEGRNDRSPQTP